MKILLIVPLPPPVTGHSLASKTLVDGLRGVHETAVVNLSMGSLNDGRITLERIREVGKVLLAVWRRKRWADAIYFTISESRAGNLKDLFIYLLCVGRLGRLFVHLHGGTIGRDLFDQHPSWRRLNASFIKRVGGVIISRAVALDIFAGMIDPARIHGSQQRRGSVVRQQAGHPRQVCGHTTTRVLSISGMTPRRLPRPRGCVARPRTRGAKEDQLDFAGSSTPRPKG
jgi:hypothetical protein